MGVLDGLADFQLGDDVNQHSDCFIDDEDDNQEWRMDPEFEYDAPQYFDFCRLLEQMKHLGHKAQYYETPE